MYIRQRIAHDLTTIRIKTHVSSTLVMYWFVDDGCCQNGHRVSDAELEPGWTEYTKRVPYSTYDITDLVQDGENVLGEFVESSSCIAL